MQWDSDARFLPGVGPSRAASLQKLGVATVGDLLCLYPRGYIDYSNPVPLAAAPYDVPCAVKATVMEKEPLRRISGGRTLLRVLVADDSGIAELLFFNNPYVADKLRMGETYLFYGKAGGALYMRQLTAPVFLPAGTAASLSPVYPLTAGLTSAGIARWVAAALAAVGENIPEPLPGALLDKYRLPGKRQALCSIHRPAAPQDVTAARRRLVFEELLCLQLGMLLLRGRKTGEAGIPMRAAGLQAFYKALPFAPTGAQRRAIEEIAKDMAGPAPMNRLLQGDVGSGKTLVAAAGVYLAAQNGAQSVLMAPTEILARQHADTLERLLASLGVAVVLLTGAVKGKERKNALAAIEDGRAQLVVGTHAVLSEPVRYHNLGLAVTDEQHRFGVRQRGLLAGKAAAGGAEPSRPHLLVMSATPIPRTLALLMFGDLDVSVLDEMPPGRKPVKTRVVKAEKRADMFGFLAREIRAGRQAYVVCPLVEEGESDLQAATAYAEEVAKPLLPNARVGLVHGRLKAADKAAVMASFKARELDVLVSTTVIEVGVDVPNASVMVIEDAERYGLSALHQLRGRVGRGSAESWCFLVSGHAGEAARERLRFLSATQDGFEVARYDLQTRGPGDFFGSRQHGLPNLHIANLAADTRVMKAAQGEALALIDEDPRLNAPEHRPLADAVQQLFDKSVVMN